MRPTQPTLNSFGLSTLLACVGVGLDHADEAMAVAQRVVDHRQIARLEDVERHLPARQQQRARQRKHRDRLRQVDRPAVLGVHRHLFALMLRSPPQAGVSKHEAAPILRDGRVPRPPQDEGGAARAPE